jgi:hypothetical protein
MRIINALRSKWALDRNQLQVMHDQLQVMKSIAEGVSNQAELINRKFEQLLETQDNQSALINRKFESVIKALENQTKDGAARQRSQNFEEAMRQRPLMIDDRTYNTNHPDYEAAVVRNFPGKIFNRAASCANPAFTRLTEGLSGDAVPDSGWDKILAEALVEASGVPGAGQVFERRTFIENYMAELARKYHAHYVAGWVNLNDALFLY